jgi:uncharacterized peroxidase-related enzyme
MIEVSTSVSRIPLTDPATVADPHVQAVYGEIEQELGFGMVPNVFRALGHQPAMLRATWDLFRSVMLQGELPRSVKEMVGVVVSAANESEYALRVHLHSLGVQEVNEEILNALAAGKDSAPGLAPSVNAVLHVAHTAARQGPQAVTEADVAVLEREGLSREELTEVIATVGLFQCINTLTDLMRVPIDAI